MRSEWDRTNKSKGLIFTSYFRTLDCNFLYFPDLYRTWSTTILYPLSCSVLFAAVGDDKFSE